MSKLEGYQQAWDDIVKSPEVSGAVPALGKILTDKEGRDFILGLGDEETKLCMKISDLVSCDLHLSPLLPHNVRQGIAEPQLKPAERQAFFIALRRFAERHGRLPERMMITGNIEVLGEILAFGGFGVIRDGKYRGERVAVKTARISSAKDLEKIRKVSLTVFP